MRCSRRPSRSSGRSNPRRKRERNRRLGDGDRARDTCAAAHPVEDVLRLLQRVRGAAQHQRLSRVSRTARRAAHGQRPGDPSRCARGAGARLRGAPAEHLRAQELLLSRLAQGLPDLPVRGATGDRRRSQLHESRARSGHGQHRAAPRRGGRGQVAARPRPREYGGGSQSLGSAAGRDRHRPRLPVPAGGSRLPPCAQGSTPVRRRLGLRPGKRQPAGGCERVGATPAGIPSSEPRPK